MDLGRQASVVGSYDGCSTTEILSGLRADVRGRQALLVDEWVGIVAWADQNVVATTEGAATLVEGVIDTGVPIAGDGAPLVSEFNLMELIAVLDRSPDGGRGYVGRVIECAWRLPGVYAAVVEGRLAPWRAERIADLTRPLNADAAAFVDRQLAAVGAVGWAQLERLVTEAIIRFDPERAEAERQAAADQRCFDFDEVDGNGLVESHSRMDAADAHDLDQALTRRAILRGKLGDDCSIDVRRSIAAGEIARADLALDLLFDPVVEVRGAPASPLPVVEVRGAPATGPLPVVEVRGAPATSLETTQPRTVPGRKVVLNIHITDTALTGENPVGRWDEGRCPISTAQIKAWLRTRETTVIVRPVIDLADCAPVDSYEIPDRIRVRVELRDHTCRFPNCTKQATRCDLDHATPHNKGGPTCPCNLVPLCRRHHRAKTFSRWRYATILPGHYLWTSPTSRHFHVGPEGTRALDPPRPVDSDDC